MLILENIHTYYGHIHALKGVSLTVEKGEIVTLIGSNGAGKTTTLNTISGLLKPREGTITLDGDRIDPLPAHKVTQRGISQSPEGRKIFARLTVKENLEMGAFNRTDPDEVRADYVRVLELFPRLRERLNQPGGTLSGGEQQMLAIGRALMSRPRILLFEIVHEINSQGTTILLVEQNAQAALQVAHRGYVLETGQIRLAGKATTLLEDPEVVEAYLGV